MEKYKTNFLKIAIIYCFAFILFVSSFMLTGCGTMYSSKAGTLDDIAGTYKLTTYKQKDDDGNEVDRIEQLHVKAYMVVGKDGNGYYAYQDDNTDFWYDTTLIQYIKDIENEELYKSIRFTIGKGEVKINKQKPGCGYEPTMGFNVNTKTFNYFIPDYTPQYSWIYPSYYTSVVYTKISEDTDLTKMASELERDLNPLPRYELKNLDGVLIFHAGMVNDEVSGGVVNSEYNKYKYYIVDFNALEEKADIYYELVEGSAGAQVENDVELEVTVVPFGEENYYQEFLMIKFFENNEYKAVITFYSVPARFLNYEVDAEPDENGTIYSIYINQFEKYSGQSQTIEDIIAEQLALYNA